MIKTAEMVAKLSDIMRYFTDEATKTRVSLQTELKFINNYIELEQIRMLHPIEIKKEIAVNEHVQVPPMLLINLIENVFKHGIDKLKGSNNICISLKEADGYLILKTVNSIVTPGDHPGKGLINLRKRLLLLYDNNFTLHTERKGDHFIAELKFPLQ